MDRKTFSRERRSEFPGTRIFCTRLCCFRKSGVCLQLKSRNGRIGDGREFRIGRPYGRRWRFVYFKHTYHYLLICSDVYCKQSKFSIVSFPPHWKVFCFTRVADFERFRADTSMKILQGGGGGRTSFCYGAGLRYAKTNDGNATTWIIPRV